VILDELLAPVGAETFFAEFHDRQPLHVRGEPAKFASVLSWRQLNRLLDMTHIWSSHSLRLVMDGQPIPPAEYCARATGRDGEAVLQPVAAKLREWIGRGASLVLNDVDSLTPGLTAVSDALEAAGLGKAQANVYVSWASHKAFPAHFDTHDVWAVQVEGEKTWNLWQGRAEWPISHPSFRGLGQAHHERAKGALREVVTLRPGDLLYLPRGWYHDALADAPASVHVAFGVNAALGMDVLALLFERALADVEFRKPLPRQDGSAGARFSLAARTGQLGQRLGEFCRDPRTIEAIERLVAGHRFARGGNDLLAARGLAAPNAAVEEAGAHRVVAAGARPVRRGAEWVLKAPMATLPLSAAEAEAVAWMVGRPDVVAAELAAAHPGIDATGLIARMTAAGVLAPT